MHDEDITDAIFTSIFDDEETYRKHYLPTVKLMVANPNRATERLKELVDNVTMTFCKNNNLQYKQVPQEAKDQIAVDLYNEIIENEIKRNKS
jgi:uncharacterized protein YaaW (UPF0174 family)